MPRQIILAIFALILAAPAAAVEPLPAPEGRVLLTVTGAIGASNRGASAVFDREMLTALGSRSIETTTIWTEGVQRFTGPPLAALLDRLGVVGGTIEATAINDYSVTLPVSDAVPGGPILAHKRNGRIMTLRGKGPLWIVYPYDEAEAYRTKVIYARSIWQLDRLHIAQ